jgi:hypothetical protein
VEKVLRERGEIDMITFCRALIVVEELTEIELLPEGRLQNIIKKKEALLKLHPTIKKHAAGKTKAGKHKLLQY